MGYDVQVMIVRESWLSPPEPITREAFLQWAQTQTNHSIFPESDGSIQLLRKTPPGESFHFASWVPSGVIWCKNPSNEDLRELVLIARHFLADTVGEAGEYYFLENEKVVAKSSSGRLLRVQPHESQVQPSEIQAARRKDRIITFVVIIAAIITFIRFCFWVASFF